MSLATKLNEDLKEAMKAKDAARLGTLRLIRAEILKKEKDGSNTAITDEVVLALLSTMAKQRRDSIEQFTAGGRAELAAQEEAELAIIKSYMPEAITDDEVRAIVREIAGSLGISGARDMGKVMGPLMGRLKASGKSFDGKHVNGLVKEVLGA